MHNTVRLPRVPFNLDAAMRGEPVETGIGVRPVELLLRRDENAPFPVLALFGDSTGPSNVIQCDTDGRIQGAVKPILFMARPIVTVPATEMPAPEVGELLRGATYFVPDLQRGLPEARKMSWSSDDTDRRLLAAGFVYTTFGDAVLAAMQMLAARAEAVHGRVS